MAVSLVASSVFQVNATSITATIPASAQVGNIAYAFVSRGTSGAITAPSGWNIIQSASTQSQATSLYWRTVQEGDSNAAFVWTFGIISRGTVVISVFSGISNPDANRSVVPYTNVTSTSRISPSLTCDPISIQWAVAKGPDPDIWTPPAGFSKAGEITQAGAGSVSATCAFSFTALSGGNTWVLPSSSPQASMFAIDVAPTDDVVSEFEGWGIAI